MATFSMKAGNALALVAGDMALGVWVSVPVPEGELGNSTVVAGALSILPGQTHVVFKGRDGSTYAQPLAVALDPESASIGTEPVPEPKRGGGKD